MSQPHPVSEAGRGTGGRWTAAALARVTVTFVSIFIVEAGVCGVAAIAPALVLSTLASAFDSPWLRLVLLAVVAAPTYVLFALCLMACSAATVRLTGARTPPDAEMRIADMEWRLLQWVRYMAALHVVRVFAGPLFRGTPIWTMYLRLNGARLGRRVFVNSLAMSDHNLLDFGNDVVIGADVHLSGHTVEHGMVRTGGVSLGDGVMIGISTVVDIDVEIGPRAQVGALSFVPKHSRLDGGQVYVGIPVRPLPRPVTPV